MEEFNETNLDEFLKQHGFEETDNLTDKQKMKILKNIIFNNDVERDLAEMRFTSISDEDKNQKVIEDFVSKIGNLDLENIIVKGHIYALRKTNEEKRKLKRKENFQKILTVFKKK